jgi:DNA-binding beta-propeller fold protein YncE
VNRRLVAWAVLAAAVVGSAVGGWALLREDSSPRVLVGSPVATIVFPAPTDAWVSTSGTKALSRVDGGWVLATYGLDGVVDTHPLDEVSVLDDHRVWELAGPPPALVIDQTEYALVDGRFVSGACYWCEVPFPNQPVVTDRHDGRWKVTVGEQVATVRQPAGWDGRPPDSGLDPSGAVVIVARLDGGSTAVVDGSTCTVKGSWAMVSAAAAGVLLHRVDPARLDYSVQRFPRCN